MNTIFFIISKTEYELAVIAIHRNIKENVEEETDESDLGPRKINFVLYKKKKIVIIRCLHKINTLSVYQLYLAYDETLKRN